jgi:undecaprenyl diphosphate synthase
VSKKAVAIETLLPAHVGIILDGNRRWAKKQGLKTLEGHKRGAEVFRELSLYLFNRGVKTVTAFVFSKENWQRAEEEVSYLMKLVVKAVELHLDEFHQANIRIRVIGERDGLSATVRKAIERTEKKTDMNTRGTLVLCFNYGGQQELVDATKKIILSGMSPDSITEQTISDAVYAPEIEPVDLLIRTSGEKRTSGFMMWRSSYAEFYFTETLWPDMTTESIELALADYAARERRFGS